MANGLKKYANKRLPGTFSIQITSMVDMFVIILVFLLKSYSTSPININPSEDLRLPMSTAQMNPDEILKLTVSQAGVFVEDDRVFEFKDGLIAQEEVDQEDPMFLRSLFEELDKKAKHTKSIAEINESIQFDGRIMVAADQNIPYDTLRKVLYTSMLAGYADVKLAVASVEF